MRKTNIAAAVIGIITPIIASCNGSDGDFMHQLIDMGTQAYQERAITRNYWLAHEFIGELETKLNNSNSNSEDPEKVLQEIGKDYIAFQKRLLEAAYQSIILGDTLLGTYEESGEWDDVEPSRRYIINPNFQLPENIGQSEVSDKDLQAKLSEFYANRADFWFKGFYQILLFADNHLENHQDLIRATYSEPEFEVITQAVLDDLNSLCNLYLQQMIDKADESLKSKELGLWTITADIYAQNN